jgi:hypothetical protein
MQELANDARSFRAGRHNAGADAAQRAALQIMCGIDIDDALKASGKRREVLEQRLERALKTERIKGLRQHWSYDLNRHIALKQALDRLRSKAVVAE